MYINEDLERKLEWIKVNRRRIKRREDNHWGCFNARTGDQVVEYGKKNGERWKGGSLRTGK